MSDDRLEPEVRRFLSQYISSVVQLEALLLLHLDAQRFWTAAELSRELRVETRWAVGELAGLCEAGLLDCEETPAPPRYRFRTDGDLGEAVRAVAQAYLTSRMAIIELIYSRPAAKIRVFADAFRLRREDDDG